MFQPSYSERFKNWQAIAKYLEGFGLLVEHHYVDDESSKCHKRHFIYAKLPELQDYGFCVEYEIEGNELGCFSCCAWEQYGGTLIGKTAVSTLREVINWAIPLIVITDCASAIKLANLPHFQ